MAMLKLRVKELIRTDIYVVIFYKDTNTFNDMSKLNVTDVLKMVRQYCFLKTTN